MDMTTRDSTAPPTPRTAPQKVDRDAVFYELTRSICPQCRRVIDAQILLRENKVYMRKRCPEHGVVEALVYGDAQAYTQMALVNKPGTLPLLFATEVDRGCPHDCGLCPEHQQHTCLGIIEVNSACNMSCPLCFANAGAGFNLALEDVEEILDDFVRAEGHPEVVQFSGGEPSIHPLDRLAEIGCAVILVPAIERSVNEHEVGRIVRFGLEQPAVKGINFQPAFHAGWHETHDPVQRMTIPDVLRCIEAQTAGLFFVSDFVPVPCCFPTCNSVTYAYVEGDTVLPLPRVLNVDDYLDYLANRVTPDPGSAIRAALEGLWSSSAVPGSEKAAGEFALSCAACNLPEGLDLQGIAERMFMVMLQDFMDPWTFNQKNVMKCCKAFLLPGGKQIPFCAYNSVGYREQARVQLAARERWVACI